LKRLTGGIVLPSLFLLGLAHSVRAHAVELPSLLPHGLHSGNVWVAADLDGDHQADWALARRVQPDGALYSQEIRIQFSTSPAATVVVRTPVGPHWLIARDLDGDTDRDLVLEGLDRRVIAVLVNDGEGHFHQGDPRDYQFRLAHPDRGDWDTLNRDTDSGASIDCPPTGSSIVFIAGSRFYLEQSPSSLAREAVAPLALPGRLPSSTRGPPFSL
jgi:hypothetical protein